MLLSSFLGFIFILVVVLISHLTLEKPKFLRLHHYIISYKTFIVDVYKMVNPKVLEEKKY